jgi:hypothetical protein
VSTIDDPGFWVTAGRWVYVVAECPECGMANVHAEYLKVAA